jgi:hypothetical protein
MTTFSFVFGLYSIIASLSITHMLTGIVALTRGRGNVRYSLAHALWVWVAFAVVIANWQSQWALRGLDIWPAWSVLLLISTALAQFVFCAFVTPEVKADEDINLHEFHERERIRFISAFLVLIGIAILYNFSFGLTGAYNNWLYDNIVSLALGILAVVAISFRNRKIQTIIAIILALISTQFLITASHIVETPSAPTSRISPLGGNTP